jgi:hypothetical protein
MPLPPSGSSANSISNSNITALSAVANVQFITQSAQAIQSALDQGLFFCVLTTFLNCNLRNLVNYYNGLGYQIIFPDVHYLYGYDQTPYSFWGEDYYSYLTMQYSASQLANPVRIRITWQLPSDNGIQVGPFISTQTSTYTLTQNNEQVLCDTANGSFTVNLPTSPMDGWVETIAKISNDSNTVTISGLGNNINGVPQGQLTIAQPEFIYSLIFQEGYGWTTFPLPLP